MKCEILKALNLCSGKSFQAFSRQTLNQAVSQKEKQYLTPYNSPAFSSNSGRLLLVLRGIQCPFKKRLKCPKVFVYHRNWIRSNSNKNWKKKHYKEVTFIIPRINAWNITSYFCHRYPLCLGFVANKSKWKHTKIDFFKFVFFLLHSTAPFDCDPFSVRVFSWKKLILDFLSNIYGIKFLRLSNRKIF